MALYNLNTKLLFLVFVVLSDFKSVVHVAQAFTVGPPPLPAVCKTMNPQHHDYKGQGSESPYTISIDKTEVNAGGSVFVNLVTTDPAVKLIGFYVQARDEKDSPVGVFTPNKDTKVHNCGGIRANAAHHADGGVKKENVTIVWTAPRKYQGEIVFTATAMKNFVTYWVFLQTEPLQVINTEVDAAAIAQSMFSTTRTTRRPLDIANRTENLSNSVRNLVNSITAIFTIPPPRRANQTIGNRIQNPTSNPSNAVNDNVSAQSTQSQNDERCNNSRVFNQWFCNLFPNTATNSG